MKKLILTLLVLFNLQNIDCAQARHISNALPSVDTADVPADFKCIICVDDIETDAELCQTICRCNRATNPIRHIFHRKCIVDSLKAIPGKNCPICDDPQTTVLYYKNDLFQAYENGDWELVETIVRYGMIPEAGWIVIACAKNNIEFARMILENGIERNPNLNINTYNCPMNNSLLNGNSLMHACYNNNLELVRPLLANGADINFYRIQEPTLNNQLIVNPLWIACASKNLKIAQFLIENGANKFSTEFPVEPTINSMKIAILYAYVINKEDSIIEQLLKVKNS